MSYNVRELIEKLEEKVEGLGIDPEFKENPAFQKAINRIHSNIVRMTMTPEEEKRVNVTEQEGKIEFQWRTQFGNTYGMTITCTKPNEFVCTTIEEKAPRRLNDGKMAREKTIIEDIATMKPDSKFLELVTNGATIDDIDCERFVSNVTPWARRYEYLPTGVMQECEEKIFNPLTMNMDFDKVDETHSLFYPRVAFENGSMSCNHYATDDLITRNKLDTAHVYSEDRNKGTKYVAYEKLSSEYGYQDLVLQGGGHSKEIIIEPLSKEEIERMIDSHPDPKVREGLRIFAKGREEYSYNSVEDPAFTYEGFEDSKERSR